MAQRKRANSRTRHTRHQGLLGRPRAVCPILCRPRALCPHQTQLQHRQPSCFFALRLDSSAHLLCLPLLAPKAEVSGLIRTTCSAWGSSNVPSARAQMPARCVGCVCTHARVCVHVCVCVWHLEKNTTVHVLGGIPPTVVWTCSWEICESYNNI